MLGNAHYFHGVLRRYVIVFGNIFNDIEIKRTDSAGGTVKRIKVPLSYGPRQKFEARLQQDPNLDKKTAIELPRMSFEMGFPLYDATRASQALTRNCVIVTDDVSNKTMNAQYAPVPYDIPFTLSIYVKYAEDGVQILEQILPFFQPAFTPSINLIPSMNETRDVPIVISSGSTEDTYEGDFETRRALIHTLEFTMKGYIYGPIKTQGIIKTANTQLYSSMDATINTDVDVRITVTPGLDANGAPTSNSSLSIPIDEINADDDYGYVTDFEQIFP